MEKLRKIFQKNAIFELKIGIFHLLRKNLHTYWISWSWNAFVVLLRSFWYLIRPNRLINVNVMIVFHFLVKLKMAAILMTS